MSVAEAEDGSQDASPEEQKLTTVNPLAIQNNMQIVTKLCAPFSIEGSQILTTCVVHTFLQPLLPEQLHLPGMCPMQCFPAYIFVSICLWQSVNLGLPK